GYAVGNGYGRDVLKTLRLASHLDRKIGGADVVGLFQNHGAFHSVLQFTNVSRPVVGEQQVASLLCDTAQALPKPKIVTLDEEVDERKNVFLAVPQRRNKDGDDAETV